MDRGVSGAVKDIPDDLLEDSRLKMGRHHAGVAGLAKKACTTKFPWLQSEHMPWQEVLETLGNCRNSSRILYCGEER